MAPNHTQTQPIPMSLDLVRLDLSQETSPTHIQLDRLLSALVGGRYSNIIYYMCDDWENIC